MRDIIWFVHRSLLVYSIESNATLGYQTEDKILLLNQNQQSEVCTRDREFVIPTLQFIAHILEVSLI